MPTFSVLVIDDEVDFMETLVNRLKKRKIEAIGVPSGEQALSLLKDRSFDIVLLDIKMPGGIDGIETLRAIRSHHPLTEVILLTGHASLETSVEGMRLGAFDYLLKPVKFEDLLRKIAVAHEKRTLAAGKTTGT
jgi:DNA-binding NtrC family response regulator